MGTLTPCSLCRVLLTEAQRLGARALVVARARVRVGSVRASRCMCGGETRRVVGG